MKLFEEMSEIPTFKQHLDVENISMYINEKGTPYNNKLPLIKTVYVFDSKFSMDQIVSSIHSSD
jgi:hypothetical protein